MGNIGHRIIPKQSCLSGPPFPRVSNCRAAKPDRIAGIPRSFPNRANTEKPLRLKVILSSAGTELIRF